MVDPPLSGATKWTRTNGRAPGPDPPGNATPELITRARAAAPRRARGDTAIGRTQYTCVARRAHAPPMLAPAVCVESYSLVVVAPPCRRHVCTGALGLARSLHRCRAHAAAMHTRTTPRALPGPRSFPPSLRHGGALPPCLPRQSIPRSAPVMCPLVFRAGSEAARTHASRPQVPVRARERPRSVAVTLG